MAPAWLDSLSEEWVSQPRSDASQHDMSNADCANSKNHSRIPRYNPGPKKSGSQRLSALGERSFSEINIPLSKRDNAKTSSTGRHLSRSTSVSSAGSVVHHSVESKSQSASPAKDKDMIPEWKRRLIHGDLAYGETKDLFSSAGNGLENIFKPPPPPEESPADDESYTANDFTLPSSPPPYTRQPRYDPQEDGASEQSLNQDITARKAPAPKQMKFRRTDDSTGDISRTHASAEDNTNSFSSLGTASQADTSRKVSGQSAVRHEDFSPIPIIKHSSQDGDVVYSMDLPGDQLRKRLDKLRRNQIVLDPDPNATSSSAAEDPVEGMDSTDDFAHNGAYINFQRGGRSGEGSFRNRPLSPPLITDSSEMLPESSLQASTPKQFPTTRSERFLSTAPQDHATSPPSPAIPRAPYPSPDKRPQQHLTASQAGSPLKLFGPYDTFTNQTLLRRISQFEDQMTNKSLDSMSDGSVLVSRPRPTSKSSYDPNLIASSASRRAQENADRSQREANAMASRFGAGELDDFEFSEDISMNSIDRSRLANKENMSPSRELRVPSRRLSFQIHQDSFTQEGSLPMQRQRMRSNTASSSVQAARMSRNSDTRMHRSFFKPADLGQLVIKREGSEGKRPRTSPSKDPTPKRRRTLHRSDIAYGLDEELDEYVHKSNQHMQSAYDSKRPDHYSDNGQSPTHPNVVAMRHILRPRSPTLNVAEFSSRRRMPLGDIPLGSEDPFDDSSCQSPAVGDTSEAFGPDGVRKPSWKSQDYYNIAEKIMAKIRDKARPKSGLQSAAESDAEAAEHNHSTMSQFDQSYESTKEPFSRPPSREGRPIPKMAQRQEDPELAARLKRYEEVGDMVSYPMESMGRINKTTQESNNVRESVQQSMHNQEAGSSAPGYAEIISDLSNVRISRNPDLLDDGFPTDNTPSRTSQSSVPSTHHTYPTGSSGGSDSRRLIGPDLVTGLIGEKVGNMVFDKQNNMWVKAKAPKSTTATFNILPSEDSEDDPFASIPDLSVDTALESRNLRLSADRHLEDMEEFVQEDSSQYPSTEDDSSLAQHSFEVETTTHTKETFTRITQAVVETAVEDDEEIEHEITIHEDRVAKSTPSRRRNLTITFSSPIASIIHEVVHGASEREQPNDLRQSANDDAAGSMRQGRHLRAGMFASGSECKSKSRSRSRGAGRSLSAKGRDFQPRPVSRIDEREEDSSPHPGASDERQVSIICTEASLVGPEPEDESPETSMVRLKPGLDRAAAGAATPVIGRYVGTLSLSPLSEFTMNHADQSAALEASYVVGNRHLVTGDGSRNVMSKALRDLVEKITEVEPFEPDWDAMDDLDISDKQLKTLHKLDEFCTSVVTLNASNNSIGHLDGVPQSVRNLRMTHNQLSELTAWGHLMNLQYIDVSNNQITSLYAFKDLVHLRSLRADNNQIVSLDGIKMHDSLQVPRARGNQITDLDFDGTKLQRLTELDLENNAISSVRNLDQLTCLGTLNLNRNRLQSFSHSSGNSMASLRYLKLSNNELQTLDSSGFPSLRMLHADRNCLASLAGFSRCRRLDSLSLREQQGSSPLDTSFLSSACEVRKLFLSGNHLAEGFNIGVDYLNLQYLELASCGLHSLPANLGQLTPNLRVLNLNYNAVADLRPLQYIPRLKKLLAVGNRLADASALSQVLAGFPHLARLDARDNPATLGFYPPLQTMVSTEDEDAASAVASEPFTLPDADPERDGKFMARLDLGTAMRRRLFEMLVLKGCKRLKFLDGLPVSAERVPRKDAVWTSLVANGVVADKAGGEVVEEVEEEEEKVPEQEANAGARA